MQLKRYAQYQMNFYGNPITASCALMGLSLFLRMLHYLGFYSLSSFGFGTIFFSIILPAASSIAYIVLLKCLRWNAPGTYGILGCVFCLLALIDSLSSGNILRIVLSIPWYPAAALILLATVGGYVPGRFLSCLFFIVPIAFRMILLVLGGAGLLQWSADASELCVLSSMACLPYTLIQVRTKQAHAK